MGDFTKKYFHLNSSAVYNSSAKNSGAGKKEFYIPELPKYIWRQFNKVVISLNIKPKSWEDRVNLFIGYKIDQGMQSSTAKSYISAIKGMLVDDGYAWNDQKLLVASLTKACKLINDKVKVTAEWVATDDNGKADALSRLEFKRFRRLGPNMDSHPTIQCSLLELILFEIYRIYGYAVQLYLTV